METRCFYVVRAEIIRKGQSQLRVSSVREVVRRGLEPEAEECPLLEDAAREWLVKI
jgi:hypothetical protein